MNQLGRILLLSGPQTQKPSGWSQVVAPAVSYCLRCQVGVSLSVFAKLSADGVTGASSETRSLTAAFKLPSSSLAATVRARRCGESALELAVCGISACTGLSDAEKSPTLFLIVAATLCLLPARLGALKTRLVQLNSACHCCVWVSYNLAQETS